MKKQYYVYTHKTLDGKLFYVGVSYHYTKGNKYTRAFGFKLRNSYWLDIFENNKKQCVVEILSDFLSKEDAYKLEIKLIGEYGKLHNGTGTLANMQDGGFVSSWGLSVCSYDYDGNFIKKFNSVAATAKYLDIRGADIIYQSIHSGIGVLKMFRFRYFNADYLSPIEKYTPNHNCYQYTKCGNFLKKWRTVEDAATELKIDRSSIRRNIYGEYHHAGGFVWSYNPIMFKKEIFEIGQYDLDDNLLNIYSNAALAAKSIDSYNSTILLCCKNKMKSTGGFKWKYIKKD